MCEKRQESGLMKIFAWVSNYLKACSASFSQSTDASFLISPLSAFQGCGRADAAAGLDLSLAEAEGTCWFSVGMAPSWRFDHGFGGVSRPFCPMVLGMLTPRSGRDSADRPPTQETGANRPWIACLTRLYGPWQRSLLVLLPTSRVSPSPSLISYHHFISHSVTHSVMQEAIVQSRQKRK